MPRLALPLRLGGKRKKVRRRAGNQEENQNKIIALTDRQAQKNQLLQQANEKEFTKIATHSRYGYDRWKCLG